MSFFPVRVMLFLVVSLALWDLRSSAPITKVELSEWDDGKENWEKSLSVPPSEDHDITSLSWNSKNVNLRNRTMPSFDRSDEMPIDSNKLNQWDGLASADKKYFIIRIRFINETTDASANSTAPTARKDEDDMPGPLKVFLFVIIILLCAIFATWYAYITKLRKSKNSRSDTASDADSAPPNVEPEISRFPPSCSGSEHNPSPDKALTGMLSAKNMKPFAEAPKESDGTATTEFSNETSRRHEVIDKPPVYSDIMQCE